MGIFGLVDQCRPDLRSRAVTGVLRMLFEITRIYSITDDQLRAVVGSFSQVPHFCTFNSDLLENRDDLGSVVHVLCPEISLSLTTLRGIIDPIPRPTIDQRIRVRTNRAFTDAVALLTDNFVDVDVPTGVLFDNQKEASPGSIQKWLRFAGQEAESMLFTEDGSQFKPHVPERHYYAFGRLMALALAHESTLGMNTETFFSTLLVPRLDEDTSPLRPIDIVRQGLEYFYPVSRILNRRVTSDEFKLLFM